MEMIGVATGLGATMSREQEHEVYKWLKETYGPTSKETWYEDYDYDLTAVVMSEDIYLMYKLKWK
jgi:hypothetical protein